MYERNINVLEMFLEKKLGYVETNNIKNNYYDYKDLVKALDDYINICNDEAKAKQEYEAAVANIDNIQRMQEKIYNQNVKFEYSRNMLFSDINRKVEDIEKCLVKIENALDKNKDTFKTLRKNFIQGIIDLNEKSRTLKKIARPKNKIELDYNNALALIKENYSSINPDDIELARKFVESSAGFEEELVEKMLRNGKDEKVPFDADAITAAAKLGLNIAQKEAENYLFMYDQTTKILGELENDKLKIDARKKHIVDVGVKISFLETEKEYLVQFLDNERVTAIQGAAEHDRLMKNCCSILNEDVAQINTLYDLIIKETKKRATNRCYEELYNKSYLENIQEKEREFINQTNNLNYANGTIISPNYWRIDSIKAIYENFDKAVYENYGRKFVAPEEQTNQKPQVVERVVERVVEKVVEKPVEKIIEKIVEKPQIITSNNEQNNSSENESHISAKKPMRFRRVKKLNRILATESNLNKTIENVKETKAFSQDIGTDISSEQQNTEIKELEIKHEKETPIEDSVENIQEKIDSLDTTNISISGKKVKEDQDIISEHIEENTDEIIEEPIEEFVEEAVEEPIEEPVSKAKKAKTERKSKKENIVNAQMEEAQLDDKLEKKPTRKSSKKNKKVEIASSLDESADLSDDTVVKKAKTKTSKSKKATEPIIPVDESEDLVEESMFENSKEKTEEEELEDIEAIIREAEASIAKQSKKSKTNIIKKMVTKNKGKYAEE